MLMDRRLPKEKRKALLKELRAMGRGPILLLVWASSADDVREARQVGEDECSLKPVRQQF
jgi:DNA-binding response OmpR family regulator